jgi:hypothetical protein
VDALAQSLDHQNDVLADGLCRKLGRVLHLDAIGTAGFRDRGPGHT